MMRLGRRTLRVLLIASVSFLASSVGEAQDTSGADRTKLRASLNLAYARAFSVAEVLIGATKTYSVACNDAKSYTTLMMIDMMLKSALETKKAIVGDLAAAAAVATPDAAANEAAVFLVNELKALPAIVADILAPAKRCQTFMQEKDAAADKAASDGDDMTWDAARQHASINILRLAEFEVAAELKDAQLLLARTK